MNNGTLMETIREAINDTVLSKTYSCIAKLIHVFFSRDI